jgi:hypothetical protein
MWGELQTGRPGQAALKAGSHLLSHQCAGCVSRPREAVLKFIATSLESTFV